MYGGTKGEMERLLKDADALNAKQGKVTKYSIDSFADIVEAIHVVQQNLGITGTSAEEAGTTIQGSLASVKAAWQDTLTAMGSGKDVDKKLANFTASVKKFGENIKPTIKTALSSAVEVVGELAPEIARELPSLVVELAPDLLKAGADIVSNLASGIYDAIEKSNFDETAGKLTEKVNEMIAGVDTKKSSEKFASVMNKIIDAVFNVTSTFDFKKAAEKLSSWLNNAINKIDWAKLGQTVSDLFVGVWDFIGTALDEIDWENVGEKIGEFISNVNWSKILTSIFKAIGGVLKAMPSLLEGLVKSLDFESASGLAAFIFAPKLGKKLLNAFRTDLDTKKSLGEAGEEVSKQVGDKVDGTGIGKKFGSKFKAAVEAFVVGWKIGTLIYNAMKPAIDDFIDEMLNGADRAKAALQKSEEGTKKTISSIQKKLKSSGITYISESEIEKYLKEKEQGGGTALSNALGRNLREQGVLGKKAEGPVEKALNAIGFAKKYGGTASQYIYDVSLYEKAKAGKLQTSGKKSLDGKSAGYDESFYSKSKTKTSGNQSTDPGVVWNEVNSDIYLDTGKLVGGTQNAYSKANSQQYNYTARGLAT